MANLTSSGVDSVVGVDTDGLLVFPVKTLFGRAEYVTVGLDVTVPVGFAAFFEISTAAVIPPPTTTAAHAPAMIFDLSEFYIFFPPFVTVCVVSGAEFALGRTFSIGICGTSVFLEISANSRVRNGIITTACRRSSFLFS